MTKKQVIEERVYTTSASTSELIIKESQKLKKCTKLEAEYDADDMEGVAC